MRSLATGAGLGLLLGAGAALGQPLVLEGAVPADGGFFTVPFDVPAGTVELEVRHDDLSSTNILDWGLLTPDGGFRGWGGGNSEPAVVGERAASRSYLVGPLPEGQWRVLVGKAYVPQRPAKWRVEVEARTAATLAPQSRTPYVAAAPLATSRRWYAGDLHVHSRESGDARPSLDEIAALAEARGLDFVALSDHNTVAQLDFTVEAQARHPSVLLVPSVEFTTYAGHLGAFGGSRFVPFWLGFEGVTLESAVADFAAQGAVVTLNHPTLDLGTFCTGCAWQHPLPKAGFGAIEVGVGGWDQTGSLFDASALVFLEGLADRGLHLAAVGGSDDHKAGKGSNQTQSALGSPTTLLFADGLSVGALADALRAGRAVVKLRGPEDPMLVLDESSGLARGGDTFVGEAAAVQATVTGGGDTLAWLENGVLAREDAIASDPFVSTFNFVAPAGKSARVRAEVRVAGNPRTVSSHLWLAPDVPPGPPVVVARVTPGGCGGCASTDGGVSALLAAVLAMRARAWRVRR